jgi:hypothetical protein
MEEEDRGVQKEWENVEDRKSMKVCKKYRKI